MKILLTLGLFLISSFCYALDSEQFMAKKVDLRNSKATLYKHESVLLGLSCSSGLVGVLSNVGVVSIGDVIKFKEYSIKVGIIDVTKFNEDFKYG